MTPEELSAALDALMLPDDPRGPIADVERLVAWLGGLDGPARAEAERTVLRAIALRMARLTTVVEKFARVAPSIEGLPEAGRAMAALSLAVARPGEHRAALNAAAREMTRAEPQIKALLAEAGQPMLATDHDEAWHLADAYDAAMSAVSEAEIVGDNEKERAAVRAALVEMVFAMRACSRFRGLALSSDVQPDMEALAERIRQTAVSSSLKSEDVRDRAVRMFLRALGVPEAVAKEALKRERSKVRRD